MTLTDEPTSMNQHFEHVQDTMSGITSVAISAVVKGLLSRAKELLESKGCTIMPGGKDRSIVIYPEGTTRQELYPRIHESRYRVLFTNGFELTEMSAVNSDEKGLQVSDEESKKFLRGTKE